MYRVINTFSDSQDNKHVYRVGDQFPRDGVTVDKERIKELSSYDNKQGQPFIEEVKEDQKEDVEDYNEEY